MPVQRKKEIYLGKCVGDLNRLSELQPNQLKENVNIIIRSAAKVFSTAESFESQGDEERAYVMYMKYFNILKVVKSKQDYKKQKDYYDSLIGKPNQIKAIERAENLSKSLKERYDLVEAEAVAKKLVDVKPTPKLETKKDIDETTKAKEKIPEPPANIRTVFDCQALCNLLRDTNTQVLLMDVRTASDFAMSHVSHTHCISVPEDILLPGSTVAHIESKLPDDSRSIWSQRKNVDHIILIDWNSTYEMVSVGTPLKTLSDALFKFDTSTIIKSEPLVLEGGYEKWLFYYPTMTTNAHVAKPSKGLEKKPSSPTLTLNFDYPMLDDNLEKVIPKEIQPVSVQDDSLSNQNKASTIIANSSMPLVDRSLKPSISSKRQQPSNNNPTAIQSEHNTENGLNENIYPQSNSTITDKSGQSTGILINQSNISKDQAMSDLVVSKMKRESEESELKNFRQNKKQTLQADKAKLEAAEQRLKDLEMMKQKEQKDVADLMRLKRKIKEEIDSERVKQEENKSRLEKEEHTRIQAIKQAEMEEEAKKARLEEVEKLRRDRKRNEMENDRKKLEETETDEKALQMKREEEKINLEKVKLERLKERQKQEEEEREIQLKMEMDKLSFEKAKLERQKQKQSSLDTQEHLNEPGDVVVRDQADELHNEIERKLQMEQEEVEQARMEEEKRRKDEEEAAAREEERKRKELEESRKRAEEEAQKKKEEETRRKEKEEKEKVAAQEREAKKPPIVNAAPQSKAVPSSNLPTGWEKRLDRATNRYFYIDHNRGETHWTPPQSTSSHPEGTYKVILKSEPTEPSMRGLSRSHSSPDITKQLEDEMKAQKPTPSVNRQMKPQQFSPQRIPKQPAYAIRKRDLNPVYGNVGQALTGLRNLGNTCYMNSTIQCLNNTSPLVSYFLNDYYIDDTNRESVQGMNGEVVDDFAAVIKALWSGKFRSITPRDLKFTVGKYNPMFQGYDQQDSQEFLTFLLDGLHEGLNEIKKAPTIPEQNNDNLKAHEAASIAWNHHKMLHKSLIVELFQGQLRSTLMCRTCKKTSVTFQAFMFLSLPIPASSRCSLNECIQEFLKPEMMVGSSRWKCPRCKVERDSEKKIDIWKLPHILLIGLNRFYHEGMWMQKKKTNVDFPVTNFDLTRHISGPPPQRSYNLYAISNHYGTMEGGHYTAFCRNPCSKKWYKFDDQDVTEMSKSDVQSSAAFVLYYTSIEMSAPQIRPHL